MADTKMGAFDQLSKPLQEIVRRRVDEMFAEGEVGRETAEQTTEFVQNRIAAKLFSRAIFTVNDANEFLYTEFGATSAPKRPADKPGALMYLPGPVRSVVSNFVDSRTADVGVVTHDVAMEETFALQLVQRGVTTTAQAVEYLTGGRTGGLERG